MMTSLLYDVIFSICGGVCSVWDNFSYLELNQLFYLFERHVIQHRIKSDDVTDA